MRSRGAAILSVSCCSLGLGARPAGAQSPAALTADTHAKTGWIGVRVTGPAGGALTPSEVVDGVSRPFATGTLSAGGTYASPRALAWRCDRRARSAAWKRIHQAVNIAIRRASSGGFAPDEVAVVELVPVFTPGERFRASIHGRAVRQGDGVHLNVAGAAIAARLLMRRLRGDGFI